MPTITGPVRGQTEAPGPLLPESSEAIWSIAVLAVPVLVIGLIAWFIYRYIRDTRRTADQAMRAVSDVRTEMRATEH